MTNYSPVENLPVVTYNSLAVITTELLAQVYGTETIRIQQNHKRNGDRFVADKHFFKLEGSELKAFKDKLSLSESVGKRARSLILWTERGAARHAKMLETEQAWEVFEKLEDFYFNKAIASSNTATRRRPQSEPLSAYDLKNLKWVITTTTNRFKYHEAWNQSIWYALRQATGIPSPHPFSVDDLPTLAQELRRIMAITNETSSLIYQLEKQILKQVVRDRNALQPLLGEMQREFEQRRLPPEACQTLEKYAELGLMRLENRIY